MPNTSKKTTRQIFGENLRRIILEKGMSLNAFADKHKLNRRMLGFWTAGEYMPAGDKIDTIAGWLGVSPTDFFQEIQEKEEKKMKEMLKKAVEMSLEVLPLTTRREFAACVVAAELSLKEGSPTDEWCYFCYCLYSKAGEITDTLSGVEKYASICCKNAAKIAECFNNDENPESGLVSPKDYFEDLERFYNLAKQG